MQCPHIADLMATSSFVPDATIDARFKNNPLVKSTEGHGTSFIIELPLAGSQSPLPTNHFPLVFPH